MPVRVRLEAPINMFYKKKTHPVRNLLAVVGVLGAMFGLGYYTAIASLVVAVESAYDKGYRNAIDKQDWKELALVDTNYSTKLCNNWWFNSTHKERKLKEYR